MRLERRNAVLLVLVLACLGADLLLRPEPRGAPAYTPLLPALDLRAARRVTVAGGSEDDAPPLVLARADEGTWSLASLHGFPAHDWVVEDLLARLRGLTTSARVSDDASAHALFGVDARARRVRVETGEGRLLAEVLVGRGPEGRGSHVRLPASAETHRAPALPFVELDPRRYLDARLFELDPAALTRVELTLPGEGLAAALERVEDGRWRAGSGRLLTPARVEPLIAWASHLYLEDVVAAAPEPAHGLDGEGWARLVLLAGGEEPLVLHVGAEVPREAGGLGERYATRPGRAPWVVTVSSDTVARLGDLARALAR